MGKLPPDVHPHPFTIGSSVQPQQRVSLTVWKQMRTEFIWIYEDTVADVFLEQVIHSSRQSAFLIREGKLMIETKQGSVVAGPGQWIFPRQGDRVQRFAPGSRVLSLCYDWKWPGNQAVFDWDIGLVLSASEAPELEEKALQIKTLADEKLSGSGTRLKNESGTLSDFFQINRAFHDWLEACALVFQRKGEELQLLSGVDSRILRVIYMLDHYLLNKPLDEKKMAQLIGLSIRQMNRLFTGQFNMTPHRYFERRRFEVAFDRVRFSTDPIKHIAYDLGFPSLSRFSTWFFKNANATPRQVRKRANPMA